MKNHIYLTILTLKPTRMAGEKDSTCKARWSQKRKLFYFHFYGINSSSYCPSRSVWPNQSQLHQTHISAQILGEYLAHLRIHNNKPSRSSRSSDILNNQHSKANELLRRNHTCICLITVANKLWRSETNFDECIIAGWLWRQGVFQCIQVTIKIIVIKHYFNQTVGCEILHRTKNRNILSSARTSLKKAFQKRLKRKKSFTFFFIPACT